MDYSVVSVLSFKVYGDLLSPSWIPLLRENIVFYDISSLKFVDVCFMAQDIVNLDECSLSA